ncbi:hypothetical protein CR513_57681, partial [Mucuna pruriens]
MRVNQTTSDKENVVEHPSTLTRIFKILLHKASESLILGQQIYVKSNSLLLLMEIIFLLLDLTTSNFNPLYPYIMFFMFQNLLTTVSLYIGLYKIEELTMGKTNGVVKEQGGLYYLQHTKIGNNINKEDFPSSQRETSKTWVAYQIWLYHKRLEHPPFRLPKVMFVESFKCNVCQFSKHHRATFSPSNNKSL